mmetsp:Transcript_23930/g.34793  ORF Transcript_23930/g.34793 Transcript_23930/m.34793 type:complete len:90 (-) Transcript_23930:262-531(-)
MQYIRQNYSSSNKSSPHYATDSIDNNDASDKSNLIQKMMDAHVIFPYDLLADDRHLYSIMPYCVGNKLFYLLKDGRFSEEDCCFWMPQT